MLSCGLFLAHSLFEADLPQVVWRQIEADPQVRVLGKQIISRLFQEGGTPAGFSKEVYFYWQIRERFRDRLAYSFSVLTFCLRPNLHDWLWFPLPPRLSFFYSLTRPVLLAHTGGSRIPDASNTKLVRWLNIGDDSIQSVGIMLSLAAFQRAWFRSASR